MGKNNHHKSYDDALAWLREHGFDILEAPGTANRIFLKKLGVSAAIEKAADGDVKIFAHPGYLIGGEIAKLIDRGYQKFLRTTKTEVSATADHLAAIHQFTEELKEATGLPSLYNESLGTVTDDHVYDRIEERDKPVAQRRKRPWEAMAKPATSKRHA
jgi:hypothetical protein